MIAEFKELIFDFFTKSKFAETNLNAINRVNGLVYIPNYVTESEERNIIEILNKSHWTADLDRHVQHYGWVFEIDDRSIQKPRYVSVLPDWASQIASKFIKDKLTDKNLDYILVNEYSPDDGLGAHVDFPSCFGAEVISLSLSSAWVMTLRNPKTLEKVNILLEPRSLLVLTSDARYLWTHSFKKGKMQKFNGEKSIRSKRISLTFREVTIPK